jgi:hypothetical protein
LDLAQKYSLPQIFVWASILASWADARANEPVGALKQIDSNLGILKSRNAHIARTVFLSMRADACLFNKMNAQAGETTANALASITSTHEKMYEAELLYRQGLALETSSPKGAKQLFRAGIRLARSQGAILFALRSSLALAKLLPEGESKDQAISELKEAHSSFKQGRSTADLRDVENFLEEA